MKFTEKLKQLGNIWSGPPSTAGAQAYNDLGNLLRNSLPQLIAALEAAGDPDINNAECPGCVGSPTPCWARRLLNALVALDALVEEPKP